MRGEVVRNNPDDSRTAGDRVDAEAAIGGGFYEWPASIFKIVFLWGTKASNVDAGQGLAGGIEHSAHYGVGWKQIDFAEERRVAQPQILFDHCKRIAEASARHMAAVFNVELDVEMRFGDLLGWN